MPWLNMGTGLVIGLMLALPMGAIMGSLAAAIAWRVPRGKDWVTGRSQCPTCHTELSAGDLVPLLAWLVLRGRCRHCGNHIPVLYPAVEAVMAIAFTAPVLANGGMWPDLLPLWLLATVLTVLSLIDFSHRYIPDGCVIVTAVLGVALSLADLTVPWGDALAGGLLLGCGTWLIRQGVSVAVGREALGLGDVKLFAAAGLWVGATGAGPLLLGSALAGLVFSMVWRRLGRGDEMPLGPCIATSLYFLATWPVSL